jgi:hypothetical protein
VFTEHELPAKLRNINTAGVLNSAEVQGSGSMLEAADQTSIEQVLTLLQQCRISVSVRHTAPQTTDAG